MKIDWNSRLENKSSISILNYIEKNDNLIKKEFLEYLYKFNKQNKIPFKNIKIQCDYNLLLLSIVNEKSLYNSNFNLNVLKKIALIHILKKQKNNYNINISNINLSELVQLRSFFKKKNIKHKFTNIHFDFLKFFKTKPFLLFQALIYLLYYFIKNFYFIFDKKYNFPIKKYDVLIQNYFTQIKIKKNNLSSDQWGFFLEKIKQKKRKIFFLHFHLNDNKNYKKVNNYLKNSSSPLCTHFFLNSLLNLPIFINVLNSYLLIFFRSFKYINSKNDNEFFVNLDFYKYLKISLYGKKFISDLFYIFLFDKFSKTNLSFKNAFYIQEFQSWEYIFNNALRNNITHQRVGYQHAYSRYWDLRYTNNFRHIKKLNFLNYYPDYYLVTGTPAFNNMKNNFFETPNIISVETTRFSNFFSNNIKIKKNKSNKIIVFGDYNKHMNELFLKDLKNHNKLFSGLKIYYKSHPSINENIKDPNLFIIDKKTPVFKILNDFDFSIIIGASTISFHCIYFKIKTIIYTPINDLNYNPLRNFKNVTNINSLSQINFNKIDSINDMNFSKLFYNSKSKIRWNKFISLIYQ